MSCCEGLNDYFFLPVPVGNGDGAIVDLGPYAADRTFLVEGAYQGIYTLMGSQDGTNFVPFLSFQAGGGSQRRQTSRENVRFVRVRRQATALATIAFGGQFTCACQQVII